MFGWGQARVAPAPTDEPKLRVDAVKRVQRAHARKGCCFALRSAVVPGMVRSSGCRRVRAPCDTLPFHHFHRPHPAARHCPRSRLCHPCPGNLSRLALFSRIMKQLYLTEEDMAKFYKAFVSIPRDLKDGGWLWDRRFGCARRPAHPHLQRCRPPRHATPQPLAA
jgi:hypothetical protein